MIEEDDEITDLLAELLEMPPEKVWDRLEEYPHDEWIIEALAEQGFPTEELEE